MPNISDETEAFSLDDEEIIEQSEVKKSSKKVDLSNIPGNLSMDKLKYVLPENFRFEGVIGEGGGGIVIKAYDTELEKFVVLKKLKKKASDTEKRTEVDILKNLNHQYLPAVHGYKTINGETYTVMDFVDGKSIGAMLEEGHKFTEKEIVRYATQLCTALDYLHTREIPVIHGDIKPHNIMVRGDGDICLIDFNISGISKDGVGYSLGYTPGYGAPEQAEDFKKTVESKRQENKEKDKTQIGVKITKRTDVYSVGATLYHMCTGEKLDINSAEKEVSGFGEGIVSIINKAVSEDPAKRYADAGEMLSALKNIHKGDHRYKNMQTRHWVIRLLILFIGVAGVSLVVQGKQKISTEITEKYNECITNLEADPDDASFAKVYDEAIALRPDEIDAYIIKSNRLFKKKEYEECIKYSEDVISYHDFYEVERLSEIYYVLGNSYFELEDYSNAEYAFEHSLNYNANNDNVIADLAIVYAREGKIDDAESMLDKVLSHGTDNEHISLVRGEIALAKEDYKTAVKYFVDYSGITDEDYEKMRAYVLTDEALLRSGRDINNVDDRIKYLSKGYREVSIENRLLILSRLAQAYIDGATIVQGEGYEEKAIEALEETIKMGWSNLSTYTNIVILSQRIMDYDTASQYIKQMDSKFPDNYQTYKRAALLEIDIQGAVGEEDRDYSVFKEYYDKALLLYDKQNSKTDAEMQLLNQAYVMLVEGNWLTEEEEQE